MERIFTNQVPKHKGELVKVAGWIQTRRDHGKLIFFDLRDQEGIVQIVATPKQEESYQLAQNLRSEWVVEIEGRAQERPDGMQNADIPTGSVEISLEKLTVFSQANTLPFAIDTDGYEIGEEHRLQYRYLDLRRERMKKNLILRNEALKLIRDFLAKEGFVEIETPILTKSTPEGARDYVVPSRLYPNKFYALPQSPQQYKQLLQVAGFERYFQIARCFRDEDTRADRQPEFTQLDIEMSFVEQEDILRLIENLYKEIVEKLFPGKRIQQFPFPRISYQEAMEKWGSDKPDLRANKEDKNELAFAFIKDFPMFEWKKEGNPSTGSGQARWDAVHHPFTKIRNPKSEIRKENAKNLTAYQHDLVLNGYEIGGGSIREHDPKILETVLEIMGNKKEDIKKQFGHLLEAFSFGAPPHGGIAPGIERLLAVVLGEPNIREVMAFPKTGDGRDLMMDSPAEISNAQRKELYLIATNPPSSAKGGLRRAKK